MKTYREKKLKLRRIKNTEKKIRQRMRTVHHVWGSDQYDGEENRLNKFNLNCGCQLCHYYKFLGNSETRLTHRDKKLLNKDVDIPD